MKKASIPERFAEKYRVLPNGCWQWQAASNDLEAVTQKVNFARGEHKNAKAANDGTCVNGHKLTVATTVKMGTPGRPNRRRCQECVNAWARANYRKNRDRILAGIRRRWKARTS